MSTQTQTADPRAEERSLVRGMLAGDEKAFEQFADTYIPALHRFASSRLRGDRELTREIVQMTMVKAIHKLSTFRGEAALMTWLCACCKTEISAYFRRSKRNGVEVEWNDEHAASATLLEESEQDGPERSFLRDEAARLVHTALDLLPERYGQVLEWKYLENLPVKEIAGRMNLRMKATESLLTRARHAFRETYARLQAGSDHD